MKRKFKKPQQQYKTKRNDPIYLKEYIHEKFNEFTTFDEYRVSLPLGYVPLNAWELLPGFFKIDEEHIDKLREACTFKCTISGNIYLGAYPLCYLSKKKPNLLATSETEKYLKEVVEEHFKEKTLQKEGALYLNKISKSLLGHGLNENLIQTEEEIQFKEFLLLLNKSESIIFKIATLL